MPIVPARRAPKSSSRKIDHAANLAWQIEKGLQGFLILREYVFHPTRKWRFDLLVYPAITDDTFVRLEREPQFRARCVAIEIEGGIFLPQAGRHNRGAGMRADLEKYAEATILGWRILRVLPEWVSSGKAFGLVARAVKGNTR